MKRIFQALAIVVAIIGTLGSAEVFDFGHAQEPHDAVVMATAGAGVGAVQLARPSGPRNACHHHGECNTIILPNTPKPLTHQGAFYRLTFSTPAHVNLPIPAIEGPIPIAQVDFKT